MILGCKDIVVRRDGKTALRETSVSLIPGEITAICGPNGAGKSTLLAVLANLVEPTSGSVTLSGKAVNAIHPLTRARNIGYLPQSAEIAWDVSVQSLVALGRLPHRDSGDAEIRQAIGICNLDELVERPVSTLSGGEKARTLLARVLAGQPQWILADEPLAALDLAHQLAMLRVLRSEAEAGCGVAVVLHDLALAMNHADRVLVLDHGRLITDAAPDEALSGGTIRDVWGVDASWIGNEGSRALVY